MTQTISRIYANETDADEAVQDLAKHGFRSDEIYVVAAPAVPSSAEMPAQQSIVDEIADRIARGYVLKRHAAEYAKKVAAGGAFVAVYAPFGSGVKATVLLDRHHPVEFRRSCAS